MNKLFVRARYYNIPLFFLFFWFVASSAFAQGAAFTYQGKLSNGGTPATGSYDIQFLLFDTTDVGTGTQQGLTITNPSVQVSAGIFTVQLDFGPDAFDGTARYVEIGVRPTDSKDPYTTLSPRQPITATPYSIRSMNASSADGLSIACVNCVTSSQIQSVAGAQISGAIPVESVPTGSGNYIQNAVAAARAGRPRVAQDGGFDLTGDGSLGGNLIVSGGVGIGYSNPTPNQLYVVNSTAGSAAVYAESGSGRAVWGKSVTSKGVFGESTSLEGVQGISSSGSGVSGVSASGIGVLGVSTSSAGVFGQSAAVNLLTSPGVFGRATGVGGTGVYALSEGSGGIGVYGESATGRGVWGKSTNSRGVYGESVNNVGVWGFSTNSTAVNGNSTNGYGVDGTTASATGFGGHFSNTGGGKALRVDGTGSVGVLEITGGLDLAEKFEVEESAKPGMLVVIDPTTTGRLSISRDAYNRRVAGIISGANSLAAGMVLANPADGKNSMPIALSGRVWVFCDATRRPIAPGDLLTTSATPGHAMKVINHTKAQGAIIGKAMTGLKTGRGLVLVLVSLQ